MFCKSVSLSAAALLCVLLPSALRAQSYRDAIQAWNGNKRADAEKRFAAIAADTKSPDRARAVLALSAIHGENGQPELAFRDFLQFTELHPEPFPYLYALRATGMTEQPAVRNLEAYETLLRRIIDAPDANITLKGLALSSLGKREAARHNTARSSKYFSQLGVLENWSAVGPFDNTSGSGFQKDFGVLQHPEGSHVFSSHTGADARWFRIPQLCNDKWLDFAHHFETEHAVMYAQTFVNSPAARKVQLLAGVSGSFKIWVNDELIAAESEECNTDMDYYGYPATLAAGTNRILVQVGTSEVQKAAFVLRLADPASGALVSGLTASHASSPYAKSASPGLAQTSRPFFAETFFLQEAARHPDDPLLRALQLGVFGHNDRRYEARRIADTLRELAPGSSMVTMRYALTLKRDGDELGHKKALEGLKLKDPDYQASLNLRFEEAVAREDWKQALAVNARSIELYGRSAATELRELGVLLHNDGMTEVSRLTGVTDRYPDDEGLLLLKYMVLLGNSKDYKSLAGMLERYLDAHDAPPVYDALLENYLKSGRKDKAIRLLEKSVAEEPCMTARMVTLGKLHLSMSQFREARDWFDRAIAVAPGTGECYANAAMAALGLNSKVGAVNMLQQAIRCNPSDYDSRRMLRQLNDKKDLFTYFSAVNAQRLYRDEQAAAVPAGNPDAVYLLKERQRLVYPEKGASEERAELLLKILTEAGLNEWKETAIPYNPYNQRLVIEKATLFKKDGSSQPAETHENQLVFSGLEKGDGIHIAYRLENSYSGRLAAHFWEDFNFNDRYPTLLARYSLLVPAGKKFNHRVYNTVLKPEVREIEDYKLYTWQKTDLPAVRPEPFMPPFEDLAERVSVSTIPDWQYVAAWYSDLSTAKTKADFSVRRQVADILAAAPAGATDVDKARLLYNYIEKNHHYSAVPFLHSALTPQRAARTLSARLGDCKDLSTLFVSMAREAGLDASLVLVNTRDNGDNGLDLPGIGFNHCIARLRPAKGEPFLIELTNNHLPFGALSENLLNAKGLYIPYGGDGSGAQLVSLNTASRPANMVVRSTEGKLSSSNATFRRQSLRTGNEAAGIRAAFTDLDEEAGIRHLSEGLGTEFATPYKIAAYHLSHLDDLSDSVLLNYDFTVERFITDIAGMQVFRLPWTDGWRNSSLVATETRKLPLTIYPFTASPRILETISLQLPAGKKLAEAPAPVQLSCPAAAYSVTYAIKGDRLVATREMRYLKDYVMPEEYPAFRDFIHKVIEADGLQFAMK